MWAIGDGVSGQWSRESLVRMYGWRCGQWELESVGSGQWAVVKGVGGADVWMDVWAIGDGVSGQWSRE